ncbi:Dihydrofolate synthase @ Folylpolyglutamate synthase [hydrothermal vent metagenome]|uniref:Dihydrofolate synthase @ Folylpolyglutamate synthase n=1 Tax=hydrothermal vent metagenome TaxID=652676 RepID=A0A3B1CNP4_9ZZZZ
MNDMDYRQALRYLDSLDFRGIKLGLANTESLLSALGDPQARYKIVHVAGTNGKGSTSAMISSILTCAGIKNGLYTSPHLETFRERIEVNGEMIGEDAAGKLVERVKKASEKNVALLPTYFEFVTAMAFERFAMEKVKVAVVEVGLGGRFDSTNIVEPSVSVITTIALDHMDRLGEDIKQIAGEKCGVIKRGKPVVSAVRDPEAAKVVLEKAGNKSSKAYMISKDFDCRRSMRTGQGEKFDFSSPEGDFEDIEVGLAGVQQIDNAASAIVAARLLRNDGIAPDDNAIRAGLATVRCRGRYETLTAWPNVILDGAHNPASASALCHTLIEREGPGRVDFIFGAMRDKDYGKMMRNLAPAAKSFTCYSPDAPRAEDPADLAAAQRDRSIPTSVIRRLDEVIRMIETAPAKTVFCVTGSFYTVGEIRVALRQTAMAGQRP